MKRTKQTFVITFIILWLIPFFMGIYFYADMPEAMPIHYNIHGVADNYASKPIALFGVPAFMLVIHLLTLFYMQNNPKKGNVPQKITIMVLWLVPVLAIVLQAGSIIYVKDLPVDMTTIVSVLVGGVIILIGNYLPKCRQNYVVGIRLPWTLDNTENWNKTHRMAGWLWIIGGGLIIFNAFLRVTWLIIGMVLFLAIIPVGYSFLLYKKG